jgi:putative hydrolase of the HAD superfamily
MLPVPELFDCVIDSSEVGLRKPNPAIFHLALERVGGIAPARAIFIDDFAGNVDAAAALGIRGVLVGHDPAPALAELRELLRP